MPIGIAESADAETTTPRRSGARRSKLMDYFAASYSALRLRHRHEARSEEQGGGGLGDDEERLNGEFATNCKTGAR